MCGIAGSVFQDGNAGRAIAAAGAMLDAIRHRGPDGTGTWQDDGEPAVALAHARLAIIDLSDAGRQPMRRGDLTVAFNGEIYNYQALRDELEALGASFRSHSDTEVLLAAFEQWGQEALSRLDGMFAIALWNRGDRSLLLARDRLGVKPLYYTRDARRLLFASEVRALLASGDVRPDLDLVSFWHFLGYQTAPTPATLVAGVQMLPPGSVLTLDRFGTATIRQYWDLMAAAAAQPAAGSDREIRDRVRALLLNAVRSHLVSDVPVAVFLSGGIDSGALVSLIRSAGATPHAFTVTLPGSRLDESAAAKQVARHFGAEHVELRLEDSDLLDMLPSVLAAVDHPSGDGVNSFAIARAVRDQGFKVALSGLGGDELFGGYPSFRRLPPILPLAQHWGRSPHAFRRAAAGAVRMAGRGSVQTTKVASMLEGGGTLASLWPVTRQLFSEHHRRALVDPLHWPGSVPPDAYEPLLEAAFARAPSADVAARISYAESTAYMHDVLLRDTDQMSMAHALEVRVPLLDHRLVEFVLAQPSRLKLGLEYPKALLAESLPVPLPADIVRARKKGFVLPFDEWMRGALRPFCETQLGPAGLDGRGLFRPGQLSRLWSGFLRRESGVGWARLWSLVALNAWMDRHHIQVPHEVLPEARQG